MPPSCLLLELEAKTSCHEMGEVTISRSRGEMLRSSPLNIPHLEFEKKDRNIMWAKISVTPNEEISRVFKHTCFGFC